MNLIKRKIEGGRRILEKGILYCVCISRIKELKNIDFKIFGVRKKLFLPEGWDHSDALAPSASLLFKAKEMEKRKEWTVEAFRNFYEPKYRQEIMLRSEAKKELATIKKHLQYGKNVAFACYCGDSQKCHRRIIGEVFENVGFEVIYN